MTNKIKVAIIGGGIAGITLAANLFKLKHLDVKLYESTPKFSEIGAGITFGANAVKAMEHLGLAEQYHSIADKVAPPFEDVWFQWRNGYTDEYLSSSLAPKVGQSSAHRADFLNVISSQMVMDRCFFNKKLKSIQETDTNILLSFEDNTSIECDYVIGADGIHSVTRNYVLQTHHLPEIHPNFTGIWAYRGIIKYEAFKDAILKAGLDVQLADVPQVFMGKDKHIISFPIRRGEEINIAACKSDRADTTLDANTLWTYAVTKQEMLNDFTDWSEGCQILLGMIEEPTIWALHELAELPTYKSQSGNVILIGDAAHAMLPHQGAGAGQGLEDAVILNALFENNDISLNSLPTISTIYEKIRQERACKTQRTSRESGEIFELYSPDYPDLKTAADHLKDRFEWLWEYSLQQDVELAKHMLQTKL